MVDQDDELFGRSRDNLFLQERAAAALDEIEVRIDLICPIDRDIDHPGIIGIDEFDSLLPGEHGCFLRRGHSAKSHSCTDLFPQRHDHVLSR